jgi:hypothetical protein
MREPSQFDQEKTQAVREVPMSEADFNTHVKRQLERDRCDGQIGGGAYRPLSSAEILTELFSYHPPNEVTLPKFAVINQAAKNFAEVILQNCPPSADRSDAIRKIREARMTANAAVALNGLSL